MSERFAVTQKAVLVGPAPEERILLLENQNGVWELPGGQLVVGEQPDKGLKRAVSEVTGLDVKVGDPVLTTAWTLDNDDGAFAAIYAARSVTEQASLLGGHARAVWMDPEQAIERELNETQRRAIRRATE
ncbi:NUDIX domain-containing protein [Halolamina sp.]|jgi:8-oxo-dGTP pyrophosphatase MutT (NUDIX family)|uniref:NUDIX hydrolase n=1 Tax=Halolamina sp. TaxID=1940283 RepID=UPI0006778E12